MTQDYENIIVRGRRQLQHALNFRVRARSHTAVVGLGIVRVRIGIVDFEDDGTGGGNEKSKEEVVYCKASCGNNVHKKCFEKWASTRKQGRDEVTCPFCRAPWQGDDDLKSLAQSGSVNDEGYVNVASELGLSGRRDYSTYHQRWVQRQFGYDYS